MSQSVAVITEPRTVLDALRRKLEKEERLPATAQKPEDPGLRNLWAYRAIRRAIPGFGWEVYSTERGKQVVRFSGYPEINGKPPSLAKLAEWVFREPGDKEEIRFERLPDGIRLTFYRVIQRMGEERGESFIRLLLSMPCSIPPMGVGFRIADWCETAMKGQPTTVFACVRADLEGAGRRSEAQRVLASIPLLGAFANEHNLKVKVVVAVNDFDAHDQAVLRSFGLDSREEFVEQTERVRTEVSAVCANMSIDGQTILATDVAGNWESWLNLARHKAKRGHIAGLAGGFVLPAGYIGETLAVLANGYLRRYGESVEVTNVLQEQAAVAATAAKVARDTYPNCLILGAGHPLLTPFYQGLGKVLRPVICLKKDGY